MTDWFGVPGGFARRAGVVLVAVLSMVSTVRAQDVGNDQGVMNLDSVLVVTFDVPSEFLLDRFDVTDEAELLRGYLQQAISRSYLNVDMDEVKPFDDYDATIYMRSCPDGQYVDCAFVMGGRANVDWIVGAIVTPQHQEGEEPSYELEIKFIDVTMAKLVLEFTVTVDAENREHFASGVVRVLASIMAGSVEQLDVRGDLGESGRKDEAEESRRLEEADELLDFEDDLGEVSRSEEGRAASRRVTREELDLLDERQDESPWSRVGMNRSQFLRYRNAGWSLKEFDRRARGRFGQLRLSVAGGVSGGLYGQAYEAWYARDETTLAVVEQFIVQEQRGVTYATSGERRNAVAGDFEAQIGIGILPWVDVGLAMGVRTGPYNHRLYQQVVGSDIPIPDIERTSATSAFVGPRVGVVAPTLLSSVRPTLQASVLWWFGTSFQGATRLQLPDFLSVQEPNTMVVVQLSPGVELEVGRWVLFWARVDCDIPVGGVMSLQYREGNIALSDLPVPEPATIGFGGHVGLSLVVPMWSEVWKPRRGGSDRDFYR